MAGPSRSRCPRTTSTSSSAPIPAAQLYSNITGYYGFFGSTGIEKAEDDLLSGEDQRLFVRRISDLFTGRKAKGGSVVLTVKPEVQQAAANALGGRKGAVVALNPTHRRDPRDGHPAGLRPEPAGQPRRTEGDRGRAGAGNNDTTSR